MDQRGMRIRRRLGEGAVADYRRSISVSCNPSALQATAARVSFCDHKQRVRADRHVADVNGATLQVAARVRCENVMTSPFNLFFCTRYSAS